MRKQAPPAPSPQVKNAHAIGTTTPPVHTASLSTTPVNEPKPEQSDFCQANGAWYVLEEAVVGLAHRTKNLPCQDSAQAVLLPRISLVVADGAGSSAVSEIGAQAVVTGTVRLLETLDKPLAELLDARATPQKESARTMGLLVVKHAIGLLKDLAVLHRREVRDFRCTFLLMVAGQRRILWVKVGDGALIVERLRPGSSQDATPPTWTSECETVGDVGKGEFANLTQFLDAVTPKDVQTGLMEATDISGMAAMSDGAAEKLVSNDGLTVAGRMSALLAQLREDRLKRTTLTKMFYEEAFCEGTTGDDRAIALAARGVSVPVGVSNVPVSVLAPAVFEMPPQESAECVVSQSPVTDIADASGNSTPEPQIKEAQTQTEPLTWWRALLLRFRVVR
jgi:hypothetical protein